MDVVKLAPLARKIVGSSVLTGGTAQVAQTDNAVEVSVPKADRQPIDTIVALKLDGPAVDAKCKLWNMKRLSAPPKTFDDPTHGADGVKAVFFEGLPWKGKPTRVFAYYGVPRSKNGAKAPAMVLIHGSGGSASLAWVKLWLDRGYAAISMDTGGNVPGSQWNNFTRHEYAGPPGWTGFDQTDLPPQDQWTYHAVADVILAHSLVRALPGVDAQRTGLAGGSCGGCLACIVAGVDPRFKFAVSVYGCGFLGVNSAWLDDFRAMGPKNANYWLGLWDPSIYLRDVKMPMLWVSGTNDFAYPLDSLRASYGLPRAPRTLSIRVRMPHNQEVSATCKEVHAFAESLFRGGAAAGPGRDSPPQRPKRRGAIPRSGPHRQGRTELHPGRRSLAKADVANHTGRIGRRRRRGLRRAAQRRYRVLFQHDRPAWAGHKQRTLRLAAGCRCNSTQTEQVTK